MKNLMIVLVMLLMSSWNNVLMEMKTISGTVYSGADGSVLPDVTVSVKGTALSTKSDGSGKYEIKVPDQSNILVFTLKDYLDKEEKVSGRSIIDVYLNPVPTKSQPEIVGRKYERGKLIRSSLPATMEM